MANESNPKIKELESEIAQLTAEISKLQKKGELGRSASRFSFGVGSWLSRKWIGADLYKSSNTLQQEISVWKDGKRDAPFQEGFDFGVAIIARITRLGIFRIMTLIIAATATSIFAISQLMLLQNQNEIIDRQRISAATEKFVYFIEQEEIARRLLGSTFDAYYPLSELDLSIESNINGGLLKIAIEAATLGQVDVSLIIQNCGVSLYPVQNPREIAKLAIQHIEENNLLGARLAADNLRRWLKSASDDCNQRLVLMSDIRSTMQLEANLPAPQKP